MKYWFASLAGVVVFAASALAQQPIPDSEVAPTFLRECKELAAFAPDLVPPCDDFIKGKSPDTLRIYLSWASKAKDELAKQGPEIAKSILKNCVANAASDSPDLSGLLYCLRLRKQGNDLEKLAKGQGSLPEYGKLTVDSTESLPAYPTENTAEAEKQRSTVREQLVNACIAEESGYVQVLCGAVAIHEAFASRPFGDNGELAKAFDKVVQIYVITEGPKKAIQAEAKEVLQRAGFNDQVAQAIADPQKGAVEGVKHLASEGQKVLDAINPFHW